MSTSRVNLEKYRIPLAEIIQATKHFSSETLVGDGGFSMVYRGQLSNHWENQQYATNRSLDYHLNDPDKRSRLTWEQRLKICLGTARGVNYLHSGLGKHCRVIHTDFKSANVLLDENMEAKICDFGLSRFCPRNQQDTLVRTRPCGTRCYIDPVYNERGRLSKECDIYSFGVVMFEVSSGMMAYKLRPLKDTNELFLIDIVRSYYDDHGLVDGLDRLKDPTIKDQIDMRSFHKFNEIAHECINMDRKKRPTMDKIIKAIEEALDFQERLLPQDYQEIIARAVPPLDFGSKKQLYFCLSDSHTFLNDGYLVNRPSL
ncbi:unnamed protein product [Lactuca saligna]|uniref:non-specific serine/threonine protein kinase n=1 Tax=Lactuca saligna TaxID=75948 RepID=A0AA35YAJ8_LACSI|nr:unnamed protein product [Lactuca saligna]